MSSPPPFGFGVPDESGGPGFDMSQLGAMLQQLGRLLQEGGSGGPVNWDLARDTARQALAESGDPAVSDAARTAVAEAVALAQLWLDPQTAFPASSSAAEAWSRAEWLERTFPSWQAIVAPVAEQVNAMLQPADPASGSGLPEELSALLPEGLPPEAAAMIAPMMGMVRQMGASAFGLQVGRGLAALAGEVLGATDIGVPLGSRRPDGDPGRRSRESGPALVPSNVEAFGDGLGIPAEEVRLYLALRECAHQRLFAHVPWLPARLEGAIDAYARGIRVDTDRLGEAMRSVDPAALTDPSRLGDALGEDMFQLEDTPEQQAALQRLETLLALVEGWVCDVVAEAAAPLPGADRLAEAVRRRRAAGGPAEKTFASLVGLELRPRALREAAALWSTLRAERGIAGRDELWAHPDLLPDHDDLDDPEGFIRRSRPETLLPGDDTGADEPDA